MYLVEWMYWQGQTAEEGSWLSQKGKLKRFTAQEISDDDERADRERKERQSKTPRTRSPVYAYNDIYLEMRAGCMEYARGLVTVLSLFFLYFIYSFFYLTFLAISRLAIGTNTVILDVSVLIITATIALFGCWIYFKYGLQITRLELLTQRRLLVRFNRKTRQVYLHRPKYAGGVTVLPWDDIQAVHDSGGTRFPIVAISPPRPDRPNMESVFIGKACATSGPMCDEWEFIRRFMEEGPEGLPKPSIRSKWPLPWHAFEPVFGGMLGLLLGRHDARHPDDFPQGVKERALRIVARLMMLAALVMISPALLILGLANWLSQLLCWESRWPQVIRDAGQPGKPAPKSTKATDYDADTCRRMYLNANLWKPKNEGE